MIETSAILSLDEDIKLNSDEVCCTLLSYNIIIVMLLCVFCSASGPNMYHLRYQYTPNDNLA